jgi:hypothetical protein
MCFAWSAIHARSRALLNRLSALTVQLELLEEAAPPSGDVSFARALVASRAELGEASREARALTDAVAGQLPVSKVADIDSAIKDTLAPLHRFLRRRETDVAAPTGERGVKVAVEPELLRFAIAAVVDALLSAAVAGEALLVEVKRRDAQAALVLSLSTRRTPPERTVVEGRLAAVRSWLEMRSGEVTVSESQSGVAVELMLPCAADETRC